MKRVPVESSAIKSIGYDPEHQLLDIEYSTGKIYRYYDVSLQVYSELMSADSHGTYVNKIIKKYKYRELSESDKE